MGAPIIQVLAGPPGAGKTSIGGAMLHALGLDYFDPEAYARGVLATGTEAHEACLAAGWAESARRLQRAVQLGRNHAFEATLAGSTIPALLRQAAESGARVRIWYFGLSDADLLVYRAQRRAGHGGWPRQEAEVRRAYERSLEGLIYLLPHLDGLRLFDNSAARAPCAQVVPAPRELMQFGHGVASWSVSDAAVIPGWAKPVFEALVSPA